MYVSSHQVQSKKKCFIQSSLNFHNPFKFAIHQLYYKTFSWTSTFGFMYRCATCYTHNLKYTRIYYMPCTFQYFISLMNLDLVIWYSWLWQLSLIIFFFEYFYHMRDGRAVFVTQVLTSLYSLLLKLHFTESTDKRSFSGFGSELVILNGKFLSMAVVLHGTTK